MGCEFCNNQDNTIDGIYQNDEGGKLIGQNMFMRTSIKSSEVLESEK